MTERPIIMQDSSVRAILDGRKTQTRRVITHRHGIHFLGGMGQEDDPSCWGWSFDGPDHSGYMVLERGLNQRHDRGMVSMPCPYGEVGDLLWVKETWQVATGARSGDLGAAVRYREDNSIQACWMPASKPLPLGLTFARWRSPLFMPRWASRLTLRITDVRVQRVQEISEDDAIAEGAQHYPDIPTGILQHSRWSMFEPSSTDDCLGTARHAFGNYWDHIHAKRAPWSSNPWVWAISFEVMP